MFSRDLADVYELVYRSRGKDWSAEAKEVTGLVRARRPDARALLDVACGTGAHLETFSALFPVTEGLEIASPMLELAAERLTGVPLHRGDMRRFRLDRRFDAVVCMFTAIGYLDDLAGMRSAVACMAGHLEPGGVLVVEPWWFPERFLDGYVAGDLAREDGRTVARMSHSTRHGRTTRMEVHFLVGDAAGITEFTEIDELTLFTRAEYEAAFTDAGCSVEFLPDRLSARGLFVGVRR
jgi:dTDP-3-amino-3,4,6-trideoxy-alpha-D-glucopyranose N,N-dimethyltransferase